MEALTDTLRIVCNGFTPGKLKAHIYKYDTSHDFVKQREFVYECVHIWVIPPGWGTICDDVPSLHP